MVLHTKKKIPSRPHFETRTAGRRVVSTRRTGAGRLCAGYVGSRGVMAKMPWQQLAPKGTHARITLIMLQIS